MRHHAVPMRPRSLLATLCALGACAGPAGEHVGERVARPVHGAERIVSQELAPAEVARSVHSATDFAKSLVADPAAPARSTRAAVNAIPAEVARLGSIRRETKDLWAGEVARLRPPPGWIGEEFRRVGTLGEDPIGRMTVLLQLDRRMLGESRDRQHRTDPDDTAPEPSWTERLARRIFP